MKNLIIFEVMKTFFQLPPHDLRERTNRGFINIGHLKSGRIQFVSGAHRADDRRVGFFRLFHQKQLSRHGVDCVDHVVILGKIKFLRGIRHVECLVGVDNRMWVDGFDAFLSDINLVFSDGGGGCDDLAVDVG